MHWSYIEKMSLLDWFCRPKKGHFLKNGECALLSFIRYVMTIYTGNVRLLVVDRRICCCSQFMIFLLELLGQTIGCLAGPSSSNRKIMN